MKWEIAVLILAFFALVVLKNLAPNASPVVNAASPELRYVNLDYLKSLASQPYLVRTDVPPYVVYTDVTSARLPGAAQAANLQVEGVDEDDYVKFDGERLYLAHGGKIYVIDRELRVAAEAACGPDCVVFVWRDKLLAYSHDGRFVDIFLYRLPDLQLVGRYFFKGAPLGARMVNGTVYIIGASDLEPSVNGLKVARAAVLDAEVPPATLVVAAVDMDTGIFNASVFVSGGAARIYMRGSRLYIAAPLGLPELAYKAAMRVWDELPQELKKRLNVSDPYAFYASLLKTPEAVDYLNRANITTATRIYVFEARGPLLRLLHVVEVPGKILDQFALEEAGGRLVVATTVAPVKFYMFKPVPIRLPQPTVIIIKRDGVPIGNITVKLPEPQPVINMQEGEPSNSVYILQGGSPVGKLEGLAAGERIYAARVVGNVLYLVTFRQVDPLFAIDLSSPERPRVLGFLKTPGFSEYLHPAGPGMLLGVGRSGNGLKIALFDVSRPAEPREISNITVDLVFSPVFYDHHAFAYSGGLAFIPAYTWFWRGAFIVEVGKGLSLKARVDLPAERAFFAGDRVYLVGPPHVWLLDSQFRPVANITLT